MNSVAEPLVLIKKKKRGDKLHLRMNAEQFMRLGMDDAEARQAEERFENALVDVIELRKTIEQLQLAVDLVEADARAKAKALFLQQYQDDQERPSTMEITTAQGKASFLFVVSDKYSSITETDAIKLNSLLPAAVHEEAVYTIDPKLFKEHREKITKALNRLRIPAKDKANLIRQTTKYSIAKGTLDRMATYQQPVALVFDSVQPNYCIQSLQMVGIGE